MAAILSAATIIKEVDLALSVEDQVEAVLKEVVAEALIRREVGEEALEADSTTTGTVKDRATEVASETQVTTRESKCSLEGVGEASHAEAIRAVGRVSLSRQAATRLLIHRNRAAEQTRFIRAGESTTMKIPSTSSQTAPTELLASFKV